MKVSVPCLAAGLYGLIRTSLAQIDPDDPDYGVRWVYPPRSENITFHYMDTVQVTWTSNFDEPLLYTFCTSNSGDPIHAGPSCWFNLRRNESSDYGSNSDGWHYELSQRTQTTLGLEPSHTATQGSLSESTSSSVTSSTTSLVSAFTTPVAHDPASDASPGPSSSNSKLSSGALAGVAVGVGLAGIVLGVLAVMIWMRRRKNPTIESKAPSDSDHDPKNPPAHGPPSTKPYAGLEGGPGRHELGSGLPPAELPTAELSTAYNQPGYDKRLWLRDML
ncbi:hypothetical protein DL769_011074 [Monosporascus sp. CRB-8-3]|nr:hypothetical protein DL769_011074 [Monosporascus sp. CRB-8-3]